MDTRRLFLAAFLSLVLVILWGTIVQPPPVQPRDPAAAPPTSPGDLGGPATDGAAGAGSLPAGSLPAGSSPASVDGEAEAATEAQALAPIIAAEIRDVVVDTDRYHAVFTNEGASLRSFVLKRELDRDGEPLELIRQRGAGDAAPFGLVSEEGTPLFAQAPFVLERQDGSTGTVDLLFTYREGLRSVRKRFTLDPRGLIDASFEVSGVSDWRIVLGPGIRDLDETGMKDRFRQPVAAYDTGEDVETVVPSKQRQDEVLPAAGLRWASLEDNYFLSAVIPESGIAGIAVRPRRQLEVSGEDGRRFLTINEAEARVADERVADDLAQVQELLVLPSANAVSLISFFGAKRYRELSELPYGLERSVRWGFFGFLARPLYYGLRWIHERVPNYGWAIVLMTLVIKLVFFPLTHKGQKSMARMQELSPKIQQVRNKYRSKLRDKHGRPNREAQQAMNEELLGLYRKEGVNPAGGCVPLLIQIPVFFAFFRLLQSAVELRNAPWIGWVRDLAAPDPWYLLPLMMLITSVLLQRMTPAPPDPMQRRIIQLMPIMFSAISVTFPAGLVLYWTTNNILTMVQQWFYHRSRKKEGTKKDPVAKDDAKKK